MANKTNDLAQNLSHKVHKIDVQVPHSVHTWIIVKKVDKKTKNQEKSIQLDWETNRYYENEA